MTKHPTAMLFVIAAALAFSTPTRAADPPFGRVVSLTQDPLVMRLSNDEFRIAFGISARGCTSNGCSGVIHYKVKWMAEDGTPMSEYRHVSYDVLPQSSRTIAVDQQYFDTSEGAHRTEVIEVTVNTITCSDTPRSD